MELVRFPAEERYFSSSKVSEFCLSSQLHVAAALTPVNLTPFPTATHYPLYKKPVRPQSSLDTVEKKSFAQAEIISSDVQPVDQS
jgi:hypothetical protein